LLDSDGETPIDDDDVSGGEHGVFEIKLHRSVDGFVEFYDRAGGELKEPADGNLSFADGDGHGDVHIEEDVDASAASCAAVKGFGEIGGLGLCFLLCLRGLALFGLILGRLFCDLSCIGHIRGFLNRSKFSLGLLCSVEKRFDDDEGVFSFRLGASASAEGSVFDNKFD